MAIFGSKFMVVKNRDETVTKGKIAHPEADIARTFPDVVRIDRQEEEEAKAGKVKHLSRRHGRKGDRPGPDGRAGRSGLPDGPRRPGDGNRVARHGGLVGDNVQSAVDARTHLIAAHEVTHRGFDRDQFGPMAIAAKPTLERGDLDATGLLWPPERAGDPGLPWRGHHDGRAAIDHLAPCG